MSEEKQETLLEFLTTYEGQIILFSPQIDLSLRPALADLFVCQWGTALGFRESSALERPVRELKTECKHHRAIGVWLRRREAGVRREDRLFARALDSLSSEASK